MRILIDDGMQINIGTGIGKYSLYLYKALLNLGVDVELLNYTSKYNSRKKSRLWYLLYINSNKFINLTKNFDVVLFTNYTMPIRKNAKVKYAVTIPDMVSYLFPLTLPFFYRFYNRFSIHHSLVHADKIFTISNAVKQEIISKFGKYANKIYVTWLGVYDDIEQKKEYLEYQNSTLIGIDKQKYFLLISTVEKRKNVGFAVEAFLAIKKKYSESSKYKFVIVGRPGYGYSEITELVNNSEYKNDIIFTGYASNSDCNRLYNHARAFIFPSIYEGFGFAQIECMKCNLPIILSDIPTNQEISRKYGLFFELNNIDSLMDQMMIIIRNQYDYENKRMLANEYLEDFKWEKIAQSYINILRM